MALERTNGPSALVLTRQKLPALDRGPGRTFASARLAARGGYVLVDAEAAGQPLTPHVILIGTGSEVHLCIEARARLAAEGIATRVVSMPSLTRFVAQPADWRDLVLPPSITARVVVEAGITRGWGDITGPAGEIVGVQRFGASAPGDVVLRELGFTPEHVVACARAALARAASFAHSGSVD